MSSLTKGLLIAGVVLLAIALFFFARRGERASATRGDAGAPAPKSDEPVREAAELVPAANSSDARSAESAARSELPADEQASPAKTGAFLELVDGATQKPLTSFLVKLLPPPQPDAPQIHVMQSDGEGRLDLSGLAKSLAPDARIAAAPLDCRLRFEPETFTPGELGRTPEQALRLVLRARPALRLRGRALDATSGAPLAGLALRAWRWTPPGVGARAIGPPGPATCEFELASVAWMVTDDEGRFESPDSYPAGELELATPNYESAIVVLDAAGDAVEARFKVGPLFLLDFAPPGGRAVTDFIAELYRDPPEAGLGEEVHDPTSPWTPADWTDVAGSAAPVHAGKPPWTRLPVEENEHPLPSFLVLVSRDGAAKGVARVDELARYRREPLFVEVRELAGLSGAVRHEGEKPSDARLSLFGPESGEQPLARRFLDLPGRFRFQGLTPGAYRLELSADQRERVSLDVRIPRAEPLELVVPPPKDLQRHVLEGRVTTGSGRPLDGSPGNARLTQVYARGGVGRFTSTALVQWNGGEGTFRFADLPADEYRLYPEFESGGFDIEPEEPRVRVPGPPVELHVRDEGEQQLLELWIVSPLKAIWVRSESEHRFRVDGAVRVDAPLLSTPDGRQGYRVLMGPYPAGAFTTLTLEGEGLRTLEVGAQEFVPVEGVWRAIVTMSAGWSAHFSAFDEERQAVPGIVLALDGVQLPASDPSGSVRADADAKPERLSVVTPGWELVEHHGWDDWGTLFTSGEFTLEAGQLDVFLRRTR